MINMNVLGELGHRKGVLENTFLENSILEFWSYALIVSILNTLSKYESHENRNYEFRDGLRKLLILFLNKIWMIKDVSQRARN